MDLHSTEESPPPRTHWDACARNQITPRKKPRLAAGPLFRRQGLTLLLAAITATIALQEARGEEPAVRLVPYTAASVDTIALESIAAISQTVAGLIAFGDTDHDGRYEAIVLWTDNFLDFSYRVFEEQGNNVYTLEYEGAELFPFAIGDLDKDGKSELIGQIGAELRVYESLTPTSHPTELIWSSALPNNHLGVATIGDSDRDGNLEIIYNVALNGDLVIYESTGDNSFAKFTMPTGPGGGAEQVVADLDGDGLIEIAFPKLSGLVLVYESPFNNCWIETWRDSTELSQPRAAVGGQDTDMNGKPELFIAGSSFVGGVWMRTSIVYEAVGDNEFARVATLYANDPGLGGDSNAMGNLDGQGADEYLMGGVGRLWVYGATAPGQWQVVGEVDDPTLAHVGLHVFDVNRNGRAEVFWTISANMTNTLVLEAAGTVAAVGDASIVRLGSLSIFPNPCRVEARLIVDPSLPAANHLAVYDAAGRFVERRRLVRNQGGRLTWPAQHLSSGVYFLRLESDNRVVARGRAMIVR